MDKNRLFIFGAIGSISIYTALIAFLVFYLTHKEVFKKIALPSEQSAVEVELEEISKPQRAEKQVLQTQPAPVVTQHKPEPTKPEPKPTKDAKEEPKEVFDPKKLMSDVVKKEQPKPQKQSTQAQSIQPQTTEAKPKSASELASSLNIKKNSDVTFSSTSKGATDEYLTMVAKIIKRGWSPLKTDSGLNASIMMSIGTDGAFTFRLKRGANPDFNDRLAEYLKTLQQRGFPPPSDGKSVNVEFNFKAKE